MKVWLSHGTLEAHSRLVPRLLALAALTLALVACSGARSEGLASITPTEQPAAGSTSTPARSPSPGPFDPGAPLVPVLPAPSPASSPLPEASSQPAQTATAIPSPPAQTASQITITREDDRKTIGISAGDRILVQLGSDFRWQVQPPDASLLMAVGAVLPAGAQGLYVALRPGPVELAATGTANCPPGVPCPLFAILFKVDLVIH